MLNRLLHIGLIGALGVLGTWIAWQELNGLAAMPSDSFLWQQTASYWFCFLIYVLLSCVFYLFIRRRPFYVLIIAHVIAAAIGLAATWLVIDEGQKKYAQLQNTVFYELRPTKLVSATMPRCKPARSTVDDGQAS